MPEIINYSLTLMLTMRIGLQAIMLMFIIDSYKHSGMRHALYAAAAYAVVLLAWCFDAIMFFEIIPVTIFTTVLQEGLMPLLIAVSLLTLAVSSKKKKEVNKWTQRQ